ncbi:hypothetical protein H6P81_021688 [Aristolochia fimbriata]|uniref:Uncharacterized protein n=1 Tax=Aristolochia fimbriata TaxID=158543 RepID=A0AAV7DP93_ARIFI|nr:hypothetical protein H6P81_021688 [Aristolochia fimbriata]
MFVAVLVLLQILPTTMYANNRYIEGYDQNVNPGNAPLVVVQLLDDECPEDFIKGLTLSVRSLLPEDLLLEQYEERNRLHLLTQFLDHFVRESSQDVFVHISLGKIIGDSNNNPEHFLQPILTMTLEWWVNIVKSVIPTWLLLLIEADSVMMSSLMLQTKLIVQAAGEICGGENGSRVVGESS